MGNVYIAPFVGSGTHADPYRPRGVAGVSGWGMFDLRVDATSGAGYCLLGSPVALSDPQLHLLAINKADTVGPLVRQGIESRLGITLGGGTAIKDILKDIAFNDRGLWKTVVASSAAQAREIWLGNELWVSVHAVTGLPMPFDPKDDFDRADEDPIAGNWTPILTGGIIRIVSNQAGGNAGANTDSFAFWNANTFNSDHWAEAQMGTADGDCGPAIRIQDTEFLNGYMTTYFGAVPAIWKIVNQTPSQVATGTGTAPLGIYIKLWGSGSTLQLRAREQTVINTTDASHTGGYPGMFIYPTNERLDNWSGANVTDDTNPKYLPWLRS